MFNWLKNKLNTLIPSDINKGMMTSLFTTIKIGDKITIPSSCVCYVSYKDKIYATLEAGTHSLNKELLIDLYQKQLKKRKKLNKLKADLFFVNTSEYNYKFDYFDKVPVRNKLTKLLFSIDINLSVNNCEKFRDAVLAEFASVTSISCENLLLEHIKDLIRSHFLKVSLDDFIVPFNEQEKVKAKLEKQLLKIGIALHSIKTSISSKNKGIEKQSFLFEEDEISTNTSQTNNTKDNLNIIDEPENLYYNEGNQIEIKKEPLTNCPNCNNKIIPGSIYCHRCGKTLK